MKKIVLVLAVALVFAGCDDGDDAPTANAGTNQTVTLANDLTITLNGANSKGASVYAWTCVSYTANKGAVTTQYTASEVTGMIANANTATATVDLCKAGTYVFKLTINGDASAADEVTVTVNPMTKNITVPAINTITDPVNFNFGTVAALSGWDTYFPATGVTYTLVLSQSGVTKATVTSTSATIISAPSGSGTNGMYTLTQTFSYKGTPITNGTRSVGIYVFGSNFAEMCVSETDDSEGSFPGLTLALSKSEL
ncbi:MAG: hypothetical protein LBH44_02740 [Treponema sp.]|jgi:hypothetical protein|nr:hypothetical protein [Treponema sp.]